MSTLLAPNNTLERMFGIDNYTEWEFWVFKKPIIKEEDENEDFWLARITHTATAIEEQIEFIERSEELLRIEVKNEVERLKNRLFQFHKDIGEIPTFKGWEGKYDEELKFEERVEKSQVFKGLKPKQSRKILKENKFRQFLRLRLEENFNVSINTIWTELYNQQNKVIENLIEIKSISGKEKKSKVYWIDDATGNEGRKLTRDNVAKAMSEIRAEIKAKK